MAWTSAIWARWIGVAAAFKQSRQQASALRQADQAGHSLLPRGIRDQDVLPPWGERGFIGKEGTEHVEECTLALVGIELTPQGLAQLLLDVTAQGVLQGPAQQLLQEVQGRSAVAVAGAKSQPT